jgi:hypothetical protein
MNSSASQEAFSGFGVETVEHVLGMRESELKKKQKEGEKAKIEEEARKKKRKKR